MIKDKINRHAVKNILWVLLSLSVLFGEWWYPYALLILIGVTVWADFLSVSGQTTLLKLFGKQVVLKGMVLPVTWLPGVYKVEGGFLLPTTLDLNDEFAGRFKLANHFDQLSLEIEAKKESLLHYLLGLLDALLIQFGEWTVKVGRIYFSGFVFVIFVILDLWNNWAAPNQAEVFFMAFAYGAVFALAGGFLAWLVGRLFKSEYRFVSVAFLTGGIITAATQTGEMWVFFLGFIYFVYEISIKISQPVNSSELCATLYRERIVYEFVQALPGYFEELRTKNFSANSYEPEVWLRDQLNVEFIEIGRYRIKLRLDPCSTQIKSQNSLPFVS